MDAPEEIVMENIPSEFREKIEGIDIEIKRLLSYVEQLGEMGKIEESERITDEIDRLKSTKQDLIILAENPTLAAKQMKVCEICGAMQAINDTEVRNQNHLEGKVHTGFAFLRNEIDRLTKRKEMLKLILQNDRTQRGDRNTKDSKEHVKRRSRSRSKDRRDRDRRRHSHRKSSRHHRHHRRDRSWSRDRSRDEERKRRKKHRKKDRKKDKKKRKHRKRHRSDSSDSESRSRTKKRERDSAKKAGASDEKGVGSGARESSSMESGELKR